MAIQTIFARQQKAFTAITKVSLALFLIFNCSLYSSCSKNNAEVYPDAINKLVSVLKSQNPDCTCDPFLNQYVWNNKTVYVSSCGGAACDCISILYDSAAHKINMDSASYQHFFRESVFIKNVWSCK